MRRDHLARIVTLSCVFAAGAIAWQPSHADHPRHSVSGFAIGAKGPSTSPKSRGTGQDLRDKMREQAPVALKGALVVIAATLLVMTLILVPIGWMRRVVQREDERSGGFALPSSKKYYVKMGSLGVPSEYEWSPPNLVVGGNRFAMHRAQKVDKLTWQIDNGTPIEFVLKEEVDEARARREAEFKAQQEAERASREFHAEDDPEQEQPDT